MRVFIDGNVILDVLQNREPFVIDSSLIWKLCEAEKLEGYVSSLTFANLVYVMRKELTPEKIDDILKKLLLIFRFADLTANDLSKAASLHWNDFEDAVQCMIAKRIHADYIITRNIGDFNQSPITALSPSEFLLGM